MVELVDVVVDAWMVFGKEIAMVEIVEEDYLMVVEVMEENCSMNVQPALVRTIN